MDEAVRETALPSRGGVCPRTGEKRKRYVARRDDYFVLGVFLIMLIKEDPQRWHKGDRQGNAFFLVLLFSIANVIIGTFLYQGLVTMTPTVINSLIHLDISEIIRIIVSNGMIVYALTRKMGGKK